MSTNYHSSFLAIVGATSFSELLTHPFEVLKVRAQIKFNDSGVNPSRFYLLKKYVGRDGIKALYKGFSPGILRAIQNQTIRLYLYGAINTIMPQSTKHDQYTHWRQLPSKFFSAFISSFVAGLTGNPWVVLKVRMIADTKGEYRTLRKAFMNVIHTDGAREFTKGTSITIARGILLSTIELTTYDTLKHVLRSDDISQRWAYFFASIISSFVAAFCSYPLDVVITLHMNDSSGGQAENRGLGQIVNLCREISSKSGIRGFYAGFSGFASRSMVYGPVFWNSLEFLNELSVEKRLRSSRKY